MTRCSTMMAVATLLFGCACGTATDAEEEVGGTSSKIVNGTDSNRESVVLLRRFDGKTAVGRCSGTMIAKNLVLTARHCISDVVDDKVVSDDKITEIFVFTGISAPASSANKAGAAARGRQSVVYDSDDVTDQDVALIVLDRDVNVPIAKLADTAPKKGDKLVTVGYGFDEDGKRVTTRRERTNRTVLANAGSRFIVDESICSGDSGGPALRAGNIVVGVAEAVIVGDGAGKTIRCVGANVTASFTSVASVSKLVDAGLKAAAAARVGRP